MGDLLDDLNDVVRQQRLQQGLGRVWARIVEDLAQTRSVSLDPTSVLTPGDDDPVSDRDFRPPFAGR